MRYETTDYPTYPQAFPGGVRVRLTDGTAFEADFPYQRGGPENPLTRRRGAREVPRERLARAAADAASRRSRTPSSRLDEQEDVAAALAPLTLAGARVSGVTVTAEQTEIVAAVREFVDRDVIPVASELEHADEFPEALVETMSEMGLFGTTIPEEYGGLGLGLDTYALIVIELSRGWMSLSGDPQRHFIAALDDPAARHGRAAASATCRSSRRASSARRSR